MGLLDEAIREHLELKRRRGADPTEIARAERDALEPVFPEEHPRGTETELDEGEQTVPGGHDVLPEDELAQSGEMPEPVSEPAPAAELPGVSTAAGHPPVDPGFSTLGQETAELDMEAYMDGVDGAAPADPAALAEPAGEAEPAGHVEPASLAEPAAHDAAPGVIGDEMLEWEQPQAGRPEPLPEQIPGQERLSLE